MKRTILSLALLASLASGAAFAADPTAAPAPPKKGGFDPNQIICREVGETGSHLPGNGFAPPGPIGRRRVITMPT